jgi:hypothetical protein
MLFVPFLSAIFLLWICSSVPFTCLASLNRSFGFFLLFLPTGLSSHLKTLPKPKSLRHVKILPETPAPRAAIFPLAFPLAGLGIVAPEPTVCAGFLTVGPAEADEGRGALGLEVHPRHGVLARGCGDREATSRGVREVRVASAHSGSRCWSIRWESTNGSVVARRRARAATFWESASGQARTRSKGVRGVS